MPVITGDEKKRGHIKLGKLLFFVIGDMYMYFYSPLNSVWIKGRVLNIRHVSRFYLLIFARHYWRWRSEASMPMVAKPHLRRCVLCGRTTHPLLLICLCFGFFWAYFCHSKLVCRPSFLKMQGECDFYVTMPKM